ncbi:uncharacterized protein SCHCODRAFT_02080289 [Schizophyllum commune H4-8]|uniref:uncharacterized protein n=1 Tax=Schizophyllum commune (strain H4-8 / FGSC 9210) TaxID=578458 RepID=UPI002160CDE7|nr:uncharacterized protein SCHCODRAFT_02080289 [Schizophyllum commune H4-8]KAI5886744.1 hypothetical protein SCHCODRAFT_02080289 [Schizophyllum commune H4-8]
MPTVAPYKGVSSTGRMRWFTPRTFLATRPGTSTRIWSKADARHALNAQLGDEVVDVALNRILPPLRVLLPLHALPQLRVVPPLRRLEGLHLRRCKADDLRLISRILHVLALLYALGAGDECLVDRGVEGRRLAGPCAARRGRIDSQGKVEHARRGRKVVKRTQTLQYRAVRRA